jgi:hypothetical protein
MVEPPKTNNRKKVIFRMVPEEIVLKKPETGLDSELRSLRKADRLLK